MIPLRWSNKLAYIVGLMATDGCLYNNGRHLCLVSKDQEQLVNFSNALNLPLMIKPHKSTYCPAGNYYHIQFSNVRFYRFLVKIGLTSNKSKTLGRLAIPNRFFLHFLRGHFDGDGYTYSYWDQVWKNSYRLYLGFISASEEHINWLRSQIQLIYNINGSLSKERRVYRLLFSKHEAIKLLGHLYHPSKNFVALGRKRFKIWKSLGIIAKQNADVVKWIYAQP